MIKISEFGAKTGTGVNIQSNTRAIQNAINTAHSKEESVLIPCGLYLSDTLYIPSNMSIVGEDKNNSILQLAGSPSGALLDCSGTSSNKVTENVTIKNLTLQHTNYFTKQDEIKGVLIRGYYTKYGEISNCIFTDYSVYAILLSMIDGNKTYAKSWNIHDCIFTDARKDYSTAIFAYNQAEYIQISNCIFNNICIAIQIANSANISVCDNVFLKCGNKDSKLPTIIASCKKGTNGGKLLLADNSINHNDYNAISLIQTGGACNQYGNRISNNDILINEFHNEVPIQLNGVQGTVITGNRICGSPNCDIDGIKLIDVDPRTRCTNNIITTNIIMKGKIMDAGRGANIIKDNLENTPA